MSIRISTIKYILWLLILLCFQNLTAQPYVADIQKLSVEDGLSNRFVNKIYKDSRGFMWIATEYGLNRYDGYRFKHYTTKNSALPSDKIRYIYEDTAQRLWIIASPDENNTKVSILDMETDTIKSFDKVFKNSAPIREDDIRVVYFSTEYEIWIGTHKGEIYRYHKNRFELVFKDPGIEIRIWESQLKPVFTSLIIPLNIIFYIDSQFLWLEQIRPGYKRTLLKINMQGEIENTYTIDYETGWIGVDKNKDLWFFQSREKKLLRLDSENDSMQTVALKTLPLPETVYRVGFHNKYYMNPADDLMWWYQALPPDYFFVFHPRKGIIIDLKDKIKSLHSYEGFVLKDIYFDVDNRVWLATNDGIFILNLRKSKFSVLRSRDNKDNSARGIVETEEGIIYINTYGGRIRANPKTGELRIKKRDSIYWLSAARDQRGNLWFGGQNPSVEKYDPLNGKRRHYRHPPPTASYPHSPWEQWSVLPDTTGIIWIGTGVGLYYLDPDKNQYRKFEQSSTFPLLEKSIIYHFFKDKEGIWIASSSGLYLLEQDKGITRRYALEEPPPFSIPYDHILHFHRDTEGIFWLATKGSGLIRFNPKDGSHKTFTTADGLSSNIIYAVYEDDYGKLWLPGNYGLMQFDKKTYRINTYLKSDGIAHDEFNTASHYRASDGRLYFGGLSGVTVIDPKDFTTDEMTMAPLRITACRLLNGKTGELTDKTTTVLNSGTLSLAPSDKSLLIEFALLNYENSRQNNYTYKIEGLDKNWNPITENRLRINALPYGNYILHIRGKSIKGARSGNELAVSIIVKKPFYLESWFILVCIIALGLLIYGFFRWRLRNLKQAKLRLQETVTQRTAEISQQKDKIEEQAEKLKELNATQSRWFTNIAHELRTPLTLILGPIRQFLKMPETGIENIQMAEKNSADLLKLVNEILDVSKLDSRKLKLNKKPGNLTQLIRESTAYFDSFARQKGVVLTTHIPEDIELNIDKDHIRKILVNLISNALKFTHAGGKVKITVQNKDKAGIIIAVADTGEGIPEKDLPHVFERYYQAAHPEQLNQGGTGIGLALSLELAKLHGGNLSAESCVGKGSSFSLSLPQSLVISIKKANMVPTVTVHPVLSGTTTTSPSETTNKGQNKPLVLLVEDNPDMRQYIRSFMNGTYRVAEAADGLEALKFLKENSPDLIISDIMMPRMDGITLAKMLKKDKTLKNIPFITLTAKAGESDKITTLRIGVDDYLSKPFNTEELEARAANLIRNYRERKTASETDPGEIPLPAHQDKLITDMKAMVLEHLQDNTFSVNSLADSQNMSPRSLQRFLKKATGLSPAQFIREIRLQQSRKLLEAKQYATILEVVYAIGYENASHFTRLFSERFGKKPSEYL